MDILHKLLPIIERSFNSADNILKSIECDNGIAHKDTLYNGDNIEAITDLFSKGYKNSIDLIYLDPPFFTKVNYKKRSAIYYDNMMQIIEHQSYSDTWAGGFEDYLNFLTVRLILMRDLLSNKGTIYVHVDYRTVHYIKIIMDYIFGMDNFLNEVIWSYKSGGSSKKSYSRKHDNILVYTKTKEYIFNPQKEKSYNRGFKPYRFKGVDEYEDELGWHTFVNLKDVWAIDMVGRTSMERVGFETQKPIALLDRIILASTNEDSIVADFFAGSGTTIVAALKNNRKWIGSDNSNSSILTIINRLKNLRYEDYELLSCREENKNTKLAIKYNIEIDDNNLYKTSILINNYNLDVNSIKTNKKYKEKIIEVLENDFISLINFVRIRDLDEIDYIIYEDIVSKDNPKLKGNIVFRTDKPWSKLEFEVMDIFGNRSVSIITYEKGNQNGKIK